MATYTVGPGGTYADFVAFGAAWNAGTIGSASEDVVADVLGSFSQTGRWLANANANPNSLVINGNGYTVTKQGEAELIEFNLSTFPTTTINDLVVDSNGLDVLTTTSGTLFLNSIVPSLTVNRCRFHNIRSAIRRTCGIAVVATGTMTLNVNNSIVHDLVSTKTNTGDRHGGIICYSATITVNANNFVVDGVTSEGACAGIGRGSGTVTINATNCAITRMTSNDSVAFAFEGNTENITTCATFNTEGQVQNIDETEYVNADGGNYRLASGSQLEDSGTDLGNVAAAITIDNFNRHTDDSRDPWDIGAYERAKDAVPYTVFIPANLRRCWHDGNGNLKPSCTTALYTSGNPTNVNQLKPSIADHATGNLKSGMTIGGDLKPSMKPVP